MQSFTVLLILLVMNLTVTAQENRKIQFPDIPGYKTAIVDLHMHSVFSDGSVWPDIRVYEAVKDGIDLISPTEHLEYQPHAEDIPHPNRNKSFEIARKIAEQENLIVVNGAEITRSMPPGHNNAVFIQDANKLLIDDPLEVFEEANRQKAFTFWNHPNWTAQYKDGIAKITDMHKELIEKGLLHGIEVANDLTYSDEALQIALDYNLTILGTSDVHGLVDWQYKVPEGGHRPVTMVYTEEKNANSIKEALMKGRTSVWFNNNLIGKEEYLVPLIESSLEVVSADYTQRHNVLPVKVKNNTGVDFILKNKTDYTFHSDSEIIEVKKHSETIIEVKTIDKISELTLKFEVLNGIIAPNVHPEIEIPVKTSL